MGATHRDHSYYEDYGNFDKWIKKEKGKKKEKEWIAHLNTSKKKEKKKDISQV